MSHDDPIHLLSYEHRCILKVVHGLSAIDQELAAGRVPDLARLRNIVAFMREFADQCHHAKEEAILFPAMEDKGVPHGGCPLEGLLHEHARGRELVGALATATAALAGGDTSASDTARSAIAGIQQLYPNHIWKEDEMVFPMARRLFTEAELDALAEVDFRLFEPRTQDHDRFVAFADEMAALLGQAQQGRAGEPEQPCGPRGNR